MPTYGKLEEFDENKEKWTQYTERLGHYFAANEVSDQDKQQSILLSVCGSKVYKLMSDLLAPEKPGDKSYDELCSLITDHLHPKPSEIVQRFKFHSSYRQAGQSVAAYTAHLRHLAQDCNFQAGCLEEMLRDRLVCGINNEKIQRRLLAEATLDFKTATGIATAMEQAEKGASDIQGQATGDVKVNVVNEKKEQTEEGKECWRCGGKHMPVDCFFKDSVCYSCNRKGHLKRRCRGESKGGVRPKTSGFQKSTHPSAWNFNQRNQRRGQKTFSRNQYVDKEEEQPREESFEEYSMYKVTDKKEDPYRVKMGLNDCEIDMEIDTGASKSVLSEQTLAQIRQETKLPLKPTKTILKTYTGDIIPVVGSCEVNVQYEGGNPVTLEAIIVKGDGPNLMGRDWLKEIKLNWSEIGHIKVHDEELELLLHEYKEVFSKDLGTVKGVTAKIHVDEGAKPKYYKARPVPFALRDKISTELDRLEANGTIEKVQYSEWAAPIVPRLKEDNTVRICGDYKVTVNRVSRLDQYPIPKTEDIFAEIGSGSKFTKLDLSDAYTQIPLDEESKKFTTINTHKGLYQYNRMCYGISSSPGIFQRTMDNILQGMDHVRARVDDILITGKSREEHISNLREVLKRLRDAGMRLKRSKCIFMAPEVVYLGHRIDEEGIHPIHEKVQAIDKLAHPTNLKELQAFCGMINYYSRFLPNLATIMSPLYKLLQSGTKWCWTEQQDKAWNDSRKLLLSSEVLVHFDAAKDVILACDASPYGLGAVLSHKMEDGSERPIGYASRTLTAAEKNYSHIEKEGLAVIFGVKKFHQYLYGKPFEIVTDHKPLLGLFKEDRQIPNMAAARIQRWAVTLSAYEYTLNYRSGKMQSNCDGLSRLPSENNYKSDPPIPAETLLLIEQLETMPVTAKQIKVWTNNDPTMAKVKYFVTAGWPNKNKNEELRPYFARRTEISEFDGLLLWGTRVIIPPKGRSQMLNELHEGHTGMSKTKSMARSYMWWPKMDRDIESRIECCEICQMTQNSPSSAPLHPWQWPEKPWSRLHIDYAGPFMGKMFLILIDAYSKWLDVYAVNSANSSTTIEKLRQSFSIQGLPDMIVSDNGSCFTSAEFNEFVKQNGIKHVTVAPYHPSSNGLAERAVQTFKEGMKKQTLGTIETKLSRFLFSYRTCPHSTTGVSPAELLMNRHLKTRLDLIKPNIGNRVQQCQFRQKLNRDRKKLREFNISDPVWVENTSTGEDWLKGTVIEVTGPLSYLVKLSKSGSVVRKHIDQIRSRVEIETLDENDTFQGPHKEIIPEVVVSVPGIGKPLSEHQEEVAVDEPTKETLFPESIADETPDPVTESVRLRPKRVISKPAKFKDYVTDFK